MRKPIIPPVGGARNPYALAEHESGKKIDWKNLSSIERKNLLEKAFRMPYSRIFSSDRESPLYRKPKKNVR